MPSVRPPAVRVDHVSIAVREIVPALEFFRRVLPVRMRVEPRPGYDDQFLWTDFFIGDWKLELIESARPRSFVESFIAKRGEGFHHLSLEVEEDALDPYVAGLEAAGLRIVDRGDWGNGDKTAFVSPRSTPGVLIQFWQVPGYRGGTPPDVPDEPVASRDGVRFRVDHLALAVRSIDATLAWLQRFFPIRAPDPTVRGWDETHLRRTVWLGDYKMTLLEPLTADGTVGRFLARRGEGLHHITIDVDRLDALAERLEGEGIRFVDRTHLLGGRTTAFVHPRDAFGVLVQFWQEPDFGGPRRG